MAITDTASERGQAEIRRLIAEQMRAICAKDVDRIMAHYAADVVVFDAIPPYQTLGADAFRKTWEACLPYFEDSFETEIRDLNVIVDGDVALAHWLMRFAGMDENHPATQTWMRFTAGYRRTEAGWRIVHEHVSVPFEPETGQAAFTLDP